MMDDYTKENMEKVARMALEGWKKSHQLLDYCVQAMDIIHGLVQHFETGNADDNLAVAATMWIEDFIGYVGECLNGTKSVD
jgi:hypothetical protein